MDSIDADERERERGIEREREGRGARVELEGGRGRLKEGVLGLPAKDVGNHGCWGGELPTGKRKIEKGGEDEGKCGLLPTWRAPIRDFLLLFFFFFKSEGKITLFSLI